MNRAFLFKTVANLWPPFLGAGIRIKRITDDFTTIDVEMKFGILNRNYVGTQFGGSIYAMTDPFFMMILLENLGKEYIVWDKAAEVKFKKPGTSKLFAHFHIPKHKIAEIRAAADANYKTEPRFTVEIKNAAGDVVAEVEKLLYVRHVSREKRA